MSDLGGGRDRVVDLAVDDRGERAGRGSGAAADIALARETSRFLNFSPVTTHDGPPAQLGQGGRSSCLPRGRGTGSVIDVDIPLCDLHGHDDAPSAVILDVAPDLPAGSGAGEEVVDGRVQLSHGHDVS
jgi:hypothetical protein